MDTNDKRISGLGLEFGPGDNHYRAYIGPPEDYDLIAAMVFNMLTSAGLRQHHKLLDIGCGSLRIGRLLIPYLNKQHYFGIEPNDWLVDAGITREVGQDLIDIKQPTFSFKTDLSEFETSVGFDFAFAQSIFSHCGKDLILKWLEEVFVQLNDTGVFFATVIYEPQDCVDSGWIYPECVGYRQQTIAEMSAEVGFSFIPLDWIHPRQSWVAFCKPGFDAHLLAEGKIRWNRFVKSVYPC